jgi:tripeptidyl-peptidase-1
MERETVPAPPSLFWSKVARSPASQTLSLTFALKLPAASAEQLNRAFHAVSNPRNPSYGAYWSQADVLALLAPSPASVNTVATFLAARGATSIDVVGNLISVTMTVAQAEAAFATTISKFEHRARRASVHRASRAYSLPLEVGVVVATIDGLLLLPRLRGTQAHADAEPNASSLGMTPWLPGTCGGACPGWLTPAIISKRYNLGAAPLTAHNGTSLAVAEFLFNYWDEGDIDSFAKACSLSGMGVLKQIGHNSPAEASIEAMLDIEYANALGGAIPLTDVALSSYQLLEWAKLLLALDPVPLVHSVSYGSDEAQQSSAGFMVSFYLPLHFTRFMLTV